MPTDDGIATGDGERIRGYLVGTGSGKVIVLHEIFGVDAQMRQTADRLAADGFTVFALDLFDGKTTDDLAQGLAFMSALDWNEAVRRIERAAAALSRDKGSVGVMGFCLGGSVALVAAARLPSLRACASFYGIPAPERADLARIRAKVIGHFGLQDPFIPNERVDAFEELLARGGVSAQIHRYEAGHGFVREHPDGEAARLAWQRTVAFLREELAPSGA